MIDLRRGDWREVLADVDQVDAVITDPPYSKRQIAGYRSGTKARDHIREDKSRGTGRRYVIPYQAWTRRDAMDLAMWSARHVRWWVVAFGDHVIWKWLEVSFQRLGWFTFAPVGWVKPNPPPRMCADGPCCAIEHILVARPRHVLPPERRGHRRGKYDAQVLPVGGCAHGEPRLVGQKPLELIEDVVTDYTIPGDLVVDPFCGSGTTAVACARLGRSCITTEIDPATLAMARARIDQAVDPDAYARARAREQGQADLFDGVQP